MSNVGVATIGYVSVLQDVIRSRPDSEEIFDAYRAALSRRWFDQESGRYDPPAPKEGGEAGLRRFHGYR